MNLLAPLFPRHDPALIDKLCELAVENALLKAKSYRTIREPRKDKGSIIKAREAKTEALRKAVGR